MGAKRAPVGRGEQRDGSAGGFELGGDVPTSAAATQFPGGQRDPLERVVVERRQRAARGPRLEHLPSS